MDAMTTREKGFLLIGLGAGLLLSCAMVALEFFLWLHHMFIVRLGHISLVLSVPLLVIFIGFVLLRRRGARIPS